MNDIELIKDILDLQNTVMYLQAQLREARNMTDAQGPNMSRAWLDEMGARLEQIKRAELAAVPSYCERFASPVNAQELIGRMCAAPLVIQYEEGEIIHTDDKPWCGDIMCECHYDPAGLEERERLLWQPHADGLLTWDEVVQRFFGKAEV